MRTGHRLTSLVITRRRRLVGGADLPVVTHRAQERANTLHAQNGGGRTGVCAVAPPPLQRVPVRVYGRRTPESKHQIFQHNSLTRYFASGINGSVNTDLDPDPERQKISTETIQSEKEKCHGLKCWMLFFLEVSSNSFLVCWIRIRSDFNLVYGSGSGKAKNFMVRSVRCASA